MPTITVEGPPPRPPRPTRNVTVKWRATRAGVAIVCECGASSPPTSSTGDREHSTWLTRHVERWHDPARPR
jgi:hypothetical protein